MSLRIGVAKDGTICVSGVYEGHLIIDGDFCPASVEAYENHKLEPSLVMSGGWVGEMTLEGKSTINDKELEEEE